jgi:hypothetical protein
MCDKSEDKSCHAATNMCVCTHTHTHTRHSGSGLSRRATDYSHPGPVESRLDTHDGAWAGHGSVPPPTRIWQPFGTGPIRVSPLAESKTTMPRCSSTLHGCHKARRVHRCPQRARIAVPKPFPLQIGSFLGTTTGGHDGDRGPPLAGTPIPVAHPSRRRLTRGPTRRSWPLPAVPRTRCYAGESPWVRDSRPLGAGMGSSAFAFADARSTATTGAWLLAQHHGGVSRGTCWPEGSAFAITVPVVVPSRDPNV